MAIEIYIESLDNNFKYKFKNEQNFSVSEKKYKLQRTFSNYKLSLAEPSKGFVISAHDANKVVSDYFYNQEDYLFKNLLLNQISIDGVVYNNYEDFAIAALPVISVLINSLLENKVDKITGKGLTTNDFTDVQLARVEDNSTNKQVITTDVTADFTLTDEHFRTTFIHKGTGTINITIPIDGLRNGFICFFKNEGIGNILLVAALGLTVDAERLLTEGSGLLEREQGTAVYYTNGDFE